MEKIPFKRLGGKFSLCIWTQWPTNFSPFYLLPFSCFAKLSLHRNVPLREEMNKAMLDFKGGYWLAGQGRRIEWKANCTLDLASGACKWVFLQSGFQITNPTERKHTTEVPDSRKYPHLETIDPCISVLGGNIKGQTWSLSVWFTGPPGQLVDHYV